MTLISITDAEWITKLATITYIIYIKLININIIIIIDSKILLA